jgi:DNA (cytosine-5)-methyltransferase 1
MDAQSGLCDSIKKRKSDGIVYDFPKGKFVGRHVGFGQFVEKDAEGPSISEHLQKSYIFKKNDGHPEIVDENFNTPVKTLCASYHKIQRITGTFVKGGKTGLRLLTENECKYIMGFDEKTIGRNFIIPVSRTSMYHQFGNSVAVPVIMALAKNIVKTLDAC